MTNRIIDLFMACIHYCIIYNVSVCNNIQNVHSAADCVLCSTWDLQSNKNQKNSFNKLYKNHTST